MTKNVKITVVGMPIASISAPLTRGTHGPVVMTIEDIFKCLVAGAIVKEVLPNGSEVLLNLSNYFKSNVVSEEDSLVISKPVADLLDEKAGEVVQIEGSSVGEEMSIPEGSVVVDETEAEEEPKAETPVEDVVEESKVEAVGEGSETPVEDVVEESKVEAVGEGSETPVDETQVKEPKPEVAVAPVNGKPNNFKSNNKSNRG